MRLFLHGALGRLDAFGPAAQEHADRDDEDQEEGRGHRGPKDELAMTGVVP